MMIDMNQAVALANTRVGARLIAIDGLPVAGKSTLARHLAKALQADCIYLDDFVKPESEWPSGIKPRPPVAFAPIVLKNT
jgi:hypothetical protein